MRPLPPPPPPPAPATRSLGDRLVDGASALLTYPLRRLITRPGRGWLWLVGGPVCGVLANHALWLLANRLRPADRPPPAHLLWLPGPLSLPAVFGGLALLLLVIVADRWPGPWPRPRRGGLLRGRQGGAGTGGATPGVHPYDWVLGRPYRRTWDEAANTFVTVPEDGGVFTLSPDELCTHVLVVAPTGMGKTRSVLEPSLEYVDRIGAAGLYLDAKGTDFAGPAFAAAHPHAFHLRFALDDPAGSFPLQLWSGRTPYDMAERLGEAILPEAAADKQYFADNARNALLGLVLAHCRVYDRMPMPPQLLHYLRDAEARKHLAESLPSGAEERYDLRRIDYLSEGRYDVLGSLDAAIQPLARGPIRRLFAPWGEGYAVADLLRAPTRVGFTLPVGRYPRVARILGRLVVAQFTHAVLDPAVARTHYKFLVVDEAHNFVTPAIAAGMAQARSNRAGYLLALQDLAQVRDETLADDLVSNAGVKIVLGGVGERDAARFSALFGAPERAYRGLTATSSASTNRSHSAGQHGNGGSSQQGQGAGQQATTSWSSTTRARATFSPWEIRSLPPHHAIVERRDGQGHVAPPTVVHFDLAYAAAVTARQREALWGPDPPAEATRPVLSLLRGSGATPAAIPSGPAAVNLVERAGTESAEGDPDHEPRAAFAESRAAPSGATGSPVTGEAVNEPADSSVTTDGVSAAESSPGLPAVEVRLGVRVGSASPRAAEDGELASETPATGDRAWPDGEPNRPFDLGALDDAVRQGLIWHAVESGTPLEDLLAQVATNGRQICAAFPTIAESIAFRLAGLAAGRGRDGEYIPNVIAQTLRLPPGRRAASVFPGLVERNMDPPL